MKGHSNALFFFISIFFFTLLFLTACGTLELDVEHTATPRRATATPGQTYTATPQETETPVDVQPDIVPGQEATPTGTPVKTDVPSPTFTSTPHPELTELRVAFVNEGDVWLWVEGREALALTQTGDAGDVKISDDGAVVAFVRGDDLWAINSDGSDERLLVTAGDFAAMQSRESFDPGVALNRFDWIPGTHILAFNTRLRTEIGLVLNDDLRLVDADTREQRLLLAPGEGGEFHFAPDGRKVAVVDPGSVSLMDFDTGEWTELFTYTPVMASSESQFYARPFWSADSDALQVAIPPADPYAQPPQATTIWHLSIDRPSASLMGNITAGPGSPFVFSPDLSRVAYLEHTEGATQGSAQPNLLITGLEGDESSATYWCCADAYVIYGWAPDSQHFAFLSNPQLPLAQIGRMHGDIVPVHQDAEVAVIDVTWVDLDRYLFLTKSPDGWDVRLGELGASSTLLASVTGRHPPLYDFVPPADSGK